MDLRIFTEPQQGATYDDLLAVARAAEAGGFDGFFRSDHYLKMGDVDGAPGPTDAWITLAALARETERIRLGTLMTAATFRHPGPLAIAVAQVDEMSRGRIEVGLGAGWYEDEHDAYGIPFPPVAERFDRLAGGSDEDEVARRAAAIGRDVGELRANGAAGSPYEVVETLRCYGDAGAERAYLQILDLADLDHLALIAGQVLPEVA